MKVLVKALRSTIGKKLIMAVTGLLLYGFALTHMAGNLLLIPGQEAFDAYAHLLETNPLLPLAELGLVALFGVHIACAFSLTFDNKKARPVDYDDKQWAGARSLGSSTMIISGVVVMVFLVIHIYDFRISKYWEIDNIKAAAAAVDGRVPSDSTAAGSALPAEAEVETPAAAPKKDKTELYLLVSTAFQNPLRVGFYLLCLAALGLHLSHGLQSTARTIGLSHPKYYPLLKHAGHGLTALVVGGFALPVVIILLRGA